MSSKKIPQGAPETTGGLVVTEWRILRHNMTRFQSKAVQNSVDACYSLERHSLTSYGRCHMITLHMQFHVKVKTSDTPFACRRYPNSTNWNLGFRGMSQIEACNTGSTIDDSELASYLASWLASQLDSYLE